MLFVCSCVFSQLSCWSVLDLLIYLTGIVTHKCFCVCSADSHSVFNGNHQSSSSNGDSKFKSAPEKLQGFLELKASSSLSSSAGKRPVPQPSPPKMLNGKNGAATENSSCNKTPPVPGRSTHATHTPVPPAYRGAGGQRTQESPKLLRSMRAETGGGSGQGIENLSLTHKPTSLKFSPAIGSSLQKRSPSPMREQGHADVPQRHRSPGPTASASPHMSRRGTPGAQGLAGFTAKSTPESPQGQRRRATKAEAVRALYAQSPSPLSEKEPASLVRPSPGSAIASGLDLSPFASPRSQRKTSSVITAGSSNKEQSVMKPYTRERKNSISEISDNEDELLEYHRWQREERLREQEMEKLVSEPHLRYLWLHTVHESGK